MKRLRIFAFKAFVILVSIFGIPFIVFASVTISEFDNTNDNHFADLTWDSHYEAVNAPGSGSPAANFTSGSQTYCSHIIVSSGTYSYRSGGEWLGATGVFQMDTTYPGYDRSDCNWSLTGTWTVTQYDGSGDLIASYTYDRAVGAASGNGSIVASSTSATVNYQDWLFVQMIYVFIGSIIMFGLLFSIFKNPRTT